MSSMTKYLKQTAQLSSMLLDTAGNPLLDMYGDPSYAAPILVRCRRERRLRDVLSQTGSTVRSETTYYFDESQQLTVGDLIDGKPVLDFEEYVDGNGVLVGYEVVV